MTLRFIISKNGVVYKNIDETYNFSHLIPIDSSRYYLSVHFFFIHNKKQTFCCRFIFQALSQLLNLDININFFYDCHHVLNIYIIFIKVPFEDLFLSCNVRFVKFCMSTMAFWFFFIFHCFIFSLIFN